MNNLDNEPQKITDINPATIESQKSPLYSKDVFKYPALFVAFGLLLAAGFYFYAEYKEQDKDSTSIQTSCEWRPSKESYGPCAMVLGVYFNGESCVPISGCDSGDDAIPFGYGQLEQCRSLCESKASKEIKFVGIVLENYLGCHADGLCYLTLQAFDDSELRVIYHYGEFPPCNNLENTSVAEFLKTGDKVEVFGKLDYSSGRMSTCDSDEYYIKKIGTVFDTSGWETYQNDNLSFSIKHPPYPFEGATETQYGPRIRLPLEEEGTNLGEKYLDIAVDGPAAQTGYLVKSDQIYIGENLFTKETRGGAAAGSRFDTYYYLINHEGKLYNFSFSMRSGNIGNYAVPPKEFNKEKESAVFEKMLETLRFIEKREGFLWENSVCGNGLCEQCESADECCNYPCTEDGACPPPTCVGQCSQDCGDR